MGNSKAPPIRKVRNREQEGGEQSFTIGNWFTGEVNLKVDQHDGVERGGSVSRGASDLIELTETDDGSPIISNKAIGVFYSDRERERERRNTPLGVLVLVLFLL